MKLKNFNACFESRRKQIFSDWYEFLRFKSISTDTNHEQDCANCAEWLCSYLGEHGLRSEIIKSNGKPIVFAEAEVSATAQSVLFYGHYDVQPVEPVELWMSDPFEPMERNGRIYARGAEDNKGQSFAVISAIIALQESNALMQNVKIIIEGEEECGSQTLSEISLSLREKIQADLLMVCDSGTFNLDTATITMGLRGVINLEVKLKGANRDLHSGTHGGVAPNPALALARLLSSLHDDNGRIAVEGYYEGIQGPSSKELKLAIGSEIDAEVYQKVIGVLPCGGEKGLSIIDRRGFQPTIDVNGMTSGYQGEGQKTIIPSWARAKITSRIAGHQDPKKCLDLLKAHLKKYQPSCLELEIYDEGIGGPALLLDTSHPVLLKACEILKDLSGNEPNYVWEGASIPVIPILSDASRGVPLLVGFGLEEDNIHAPNESFSLDQFKQCFLYASLLLSEKDLLNKKEFKKAV